MAGTISFAGIGSQLDVESIVTGLVEASKGTLNAVNSRVTNTKSAASSVSEISSLLAKLGTAARALDESNETKGNTASSTSSAIAASAIGTAVPGTYGVKVLGLATEARVYSNSYASTDSALGQVGSLGLSIGGTSATVNIAADDTINSLVTKINGSGLRVSATTVYDGSRYRMVLNGLDKGSTNALTTTQTGVDLGLNLEANIKQRAANARVEIDDFLVESQSNQIVGAIPGVTLAVSKTTDTKETVTVASDPEALKTKLQSVVDAYNAVVSKVHTVSGFGSTAASNSLLAGDSTLRSLSTRMSNAAMTRVSTGTAYESLSSIGIALGRDGTLSFDSSKLKTAMASDPASVSQILAGGSNGTGLMDVFRDMSDAMTTSNTGLLSTKVTTLGSQTKSLQDRATREQARLDRYAEQLRSQFAGIEQSVAGSYADLDYLSALYSQK